VLRPGTRLPAVRELAATEGVAHVTVSHVYRALKRDGLSVVRPGKGTCVAGAHGAHPGKGKAALYRLVDALVTRALKSGYRPAEISHMVMLQGIAGCMVLERPPLWAVLSDTERVRAVLAQADAVVYARGSEAIRADVPEGKPAIEYLHTPQPSSVEAVRPRIARLSGLWPHANGHRRCT
jgi:DNA-binding transcriptional regulator YhcF (GntR family)